LHIGSVRTALFNYLFARSQSGEFHLRIEDTDRERSKPEFEAEILKSMEWLGFRLDGPVLRQSERFAHYVEVAEKMAALGAAYVSTEKGGRAIVFKIPKSRVSFTDLVHGEISFDSDFFEDLVLIKSDGSAAYNFACVVDDHDMDITHVIRGDDHISNTPKQILLYQALGYPVPQFAHLPLIVGPDNAPLSKRHGSVSLPFYQEEGYVAEALLNYLALLGWSPGGEREIFRLEELIAEFRMNGVNSKAACFDNEKLRWLNGEHLRALDPETFRNRLVDYCRNFGGPGMAADTEAIRRAALLFKDRIKTFKEFGTQADYFFKPEVTFDPVAVKKHWKEDAARAHLEYLAGELGGADFSRPDALEMSVRDAAQRRGVSAGALIHPLRVALTGRSVSPGIFELLSALGKEQALSRLQFAVRHFEELKTGLLAGGAGAGAARGAE
jgi:glutamyl-tRNA synthetase